MNNLKETIETAFDQRESLDLGNPAAELREAIQTSIGLLDSGEARVAEPKADGSGWQVNEWLKKAVLLSFATESNEIIEAGHTNYFDKVPLKFAGWTKQQFNDAGVRVVPDAGHSSFEAGIVHELIEATDQFAGV